MVKDEHGCLDRMETRMPSMTPDSRRPVFMVDAAQSSGICTSRGVSCDRVTFHPKPRRKRISSSEMVLIFSTKLSAAHTQERGPLTAGHRPGGAVEHTVH